MSGVRPDLSNANQNHEPLLVEPLVLALEHPPDPEEAFLRLAGRTHCLFLDSARRDRQLGRYSFLAADPFEYFEYRVDDARALDKLEQGLARYRMETLPGLPPFQGGAAGLLGYDLGRQLERLPQPAIDEFQMPCLAIGFYDVVLAYDHQEHRAWIISLGLPETDPVRRQRRADDRMREMESLLDVSRRRISAPVPPQVDRFPTTLPNTSLAPQFVVNGPNGLTSNFSREGYLTAVERAIEYIRAGDIFQVNLAQRLLFPARDDAIALYQRLRRQNAATFAAYFDLGAFQIVSASPERFLQVRAGEVEARPIKGTRLRTRSPEADLFSGDELQDSEKDRAENVMIVDLLRNDLSRVCTPQSVRVSELCRLESYEYVQHLVSVVQGTLRSDHAPLDLMRAAFPGGSITGAPKVRAMEIIAELEPTARGAYCGALGYFGFDGACDTSILIRTITAGRGWWQAPVGGGIVAQSLPEREYAETWHKAEGLLRALAPKSPTS